MRFFDPRGTGHYLPEQMLSVFADFELEGAHVAKM